MKYLLIFCLFSLNICLSNQEEPYFEIHFQSYFKDDLIGLKIENSLIFKELKVSSDVYENGEISIPFSFTQVVIKCFKEGDKFIVKYENKEKAKLKISENGLITLEAFVNQKKTVFHVDLSKGKYIGIRKEYFDNENLILRQSYIPFEYD